MTDIENILNNAEIIAEKSEIESQIDRVAIEITNKVADKNPILICIMNGGFIFAASLMQRLKFPLRFDYIHATRYLDETVGGKIEWIKYPSMNLEGETIIIVDDILDEGLTVAAVKQKCIELGAKEIFIAMLVEKKHNRKAVGIKADFTAFVCEERFIFGWGLDYKGYWRNAEHIYALNFNSPKNNIP